MTSRTTLSLLALAAMTFFGRDACLCGGGGGNRPPPAPSASSSAPVTGQAAPTAKPN